MLCLVYLADFRFLSHWQLILCHSPWWINDSCLNFPIFKTGLVTVCHRAIGNFKLHNYYNGVKDCLSAGESSPDIQRWGLARCPRVYASRWENTMTGKFWAFLGHHHLPRVTLFSYSFMSSVQFRDHSLFCRKDRLAEGSHCGLKKMLLAFSPQYFLKFCCQLNICL